MTANSIKEPYFLITTDFVESWPKGKKLLFIDRQLLAPLESQNIAEYELIDNSLEDEFVQTVKNDFTTALSRKLLVCVASSGKSAGGKLSTTYQPRSSRAWATVDRPAPDIPVTINNSLLAMAIFCLHCQGSLNS